VLYPNIDVSNHLGGNDGMLFAHYTKREKRLRTKAKTLNGHIDEQIDYLDKVVNSGKVIGF
jgi:hypothetical protein